MRINLNDPDDFTFENLRKLIASDDDSVNTQFRVTSDGFLFISKHYSNQNLDGIALRLRTNIGGFGNVGLDASLDDRWVKLIYDTIQYNWPSPIYSIVEFVS